MENKMKRCPICKKCYADTPAISRSDNKTLICPICGTKEALDDSGISADGQKEILDTVHKYYGKFGSEMEKEGEEEDGK